VNVTHQRTAYQDIFVVADNGIGIAPQDHDRIFEIFESSESIDKYGNKGAGVGLSTVKSIVLKLKASISVESQLGQGTSISIMLPY
jgi:signal transduction histidine kinase